MTEQVYKFLTAPKKTKAEIARIDEKISNLRMMMLPGAIRYDKDKVQSSPKDSMLQYIERLSDLETKRKELLALYLEQQDAIEAVIENIDDVYIRQIMTMRYISCKGWTEINDAMPFVQRTVFRFNKMGLMFIERYLSGQVKLVSECQ